MSLSTTQQIFERVNESKNILITFKKDFSGDALASASALSQLLEKSGKKTEIVCDGFVLPKNFQFIPKVKEIKSAIKNLRKFVISLDISQTKVDEFNYSVNGDKLDIIITPKEGAFSPEHVSAKQSKFMYDLIFVLDSSDLESLGRIYDDNTEFFYQTPIINIDHSPSNEHFGQINLVEITATSTAEILFNLFEDFGSELMDENIGTSILAGLFSSTRSFKTSKVTPKALNTASQLVSLGAKRDEIVKYLYQTKSLNTLKLWGRALARIKNDENSKLVWTILKKEDFQNTQTSEEHLLEVIDELISNMPGLEIIVLIYQNSEHDVKTLVRAERNIDAQKITKRFNSQGSKNIATFQLPKQDLLEAERDVIDEIKTNLNSISK